MLKMTNLSLRTTGYGANKATQMVSCKFSITHRLVCPKYFKLTVFLTFDRSSLPTFSMRKMNKIRHNIANNFLATSLKCGISHALTCPKKRPKWLKKLKRIHLAKFEHSCLLTSITEIKQ